MTDEQRQMLLGRMKEELTSLETEIRQLEDATKPISPDNAIGRVSRMDAIGNKRINEQALDSVRQRKTHIESALSKADAADFGLCMICMMPIPIERFLAIPEASLCIQCANR